MPQNLVFPTVQSDKSDIRFHFDEIYSATCDFFVFSRDFITFDGMMWGALL